MKVTIKAMRVNAGKTLDEASEAIGVSKRTLINWEQHKTYPMVDQLFALCKCYGCTIDDIFLPERLAKSE